MGCERERRLRASRGPKTSRAWKPGKSTTAKERGGLVGAAAAAAGETVRKGREIVSFG